nr:vacuolar protein sorting associated protein 37b [Hymenolepis microstoma]
MDVRNSNQGVGFNGVAMENFHDKLIGMSKEDLERLFNDQERIRKMVLESNTLKNMKSTKKRLLKSNQQKAAKNLENEPKMENIRENLIAAHQEFNETLKEYSSYKSKLDEIRGSFSTQTMLALMNVANAEEDELSEQLQKDLLNKKIELDKFLTRMYELRKSYNMRRIRIDKLSELENSAHGYHSPPRPAYPSQFSPLSHNRSGPYPKL